MENSEFINDSHESNEIIHFYRGHHCKVFSHAALPGLILKREKLLEILQSVSDKIDPEKYLTNLIIKTMEFHGSHPHSDTLLTLVCFGPQRFKIPEAFLEMENLFVCALKNLKSPYLATESDILASLDIIRCIFIGVSNLMMSETSSEGKSRGLAITENALKVLLRGWRK